MEAPLITPTRPRNWSREATTFRSTTNTGTTDAVRTRLGRPRLRPDGREVFATMARENPAWGSERTRGELLKLGISVSTRTIQRYRQRGPAHPPSQTWRTFLANHAYQLWAVDLLVVQTLTVQPLDVLALIAHGRRELVRVAVTAHHTAAWI